MRLFVIDGEDVQGWLRLEAAHDPQPLPLASPDEVIGEYAGVVVAAGDDMKMQRLAACEGRTVVDPTRASSIADNVLDDFDRLVGVPVGGQPCRSSNQVTVCPESRRQPHRVDSRSTS
jgi:hypothetical protein